MQELLENAHLFKQASPSRVREGLYLGGIFSLKGFAKLGVTHILSVTEMSAEDMKILKDWDPDFKTVQHMVIFEDDHPRTDLLKYFPKAVHFIESAIADGGKVFVHCMQGISRSATIVAAYLMKVEELSRDAAVQSIKFSRAGIHPNPGFMDQLLTWQINKCKDPNAPSLNGTPEVITEPESSADARLSETLAELLREKEPSEVRPGLYLGGIRSLQVVEHLHITHVLSATDITGPWLPSGRAAINRAQSGQSASTSGQTAEPPYKRLFIDVQDLPNEDLLVHFPKAIAFIAEARSEGGAVLVHCFAGVSRSVTLVTAYLMKTEGLSRDDALDSVRQARSCADPNAGFRRQLQQWEDMGCEIKADSPSTQRRALDSLTDRALADANGHPSLTSSDLMPSPSEDAALMTSSSSSSGGNAREGGVMYRCRTCRRLLATEDSIMPLDDSGAVGTDESSLFVSPMKYMETSILGVMQGKLYCPKCKARLGSFNWAGMKNSKGVIVVPAFQLHLSRMDKMLQQPLGASRI
ncbi:hypothetical protein WJX73_001963 [Symbiochloris irregularis]|uniref:protein-tyrosine-phosphatase n=1 Tax=Symbiochloris irregularis TaxID=706552 RepID=A0AAW1PJB0_9CHLO